MRAAKGTTRDNTGWTLRFLNRPWQPISQHETHKDGERMRSYQDWICQNKILSIQTQVSGGLPTLTSIMFNRTSCSINVKRSATSTQSSQCLRSLNVHEPMVTEGDILNEIPARPKKTWKTHQNPIFLSHTCPKRSMEQPPKKDFWFGNQLYSRWAGV